MATATFTANNFMIDKVRRVTQVNLETNKVDWTLTSIEDPQIEFTGESVDKTDAQGVLLARFDTAKGVNFTGNGSTLSLPLIAAQRGTEMQVADEDHKITGETFEIVKVDPETRKATLSFKPKTDPAYVSLIGEDKNITGEVEVGIDGETKATIADNVITMPESFKGGSIGVLYEYETTEAVKVVDGSENYATAAKYLVDILAADVCHPDLKRAGTIVFPKAKLDNNVSIGLTTEGNHPFSFSALKDYCSEDAELCYILFRK